MGESSGIAPDQGQVSDNSFKDTAGCGWISWELDHWPIGWTNAQGHTRQPDSPYPYCICQLSHYLTPKLLGSYDPDYINITKDMEHNQWTERHVFYQLLGVGKDCESIRRLARQWLDQGEKCAAAESIADLRSAIAQDAAPSPLPEPKKIINYGGGGWKDSQVQEPCIMVNPKDASKLIMFYGAFGGGSGCLGKAWADVSDPFTWHEDPNNPLFRGDPKIAFEGIHSPRFGDL